MFCVAYRLKNKLWFNLLPLLLLQYGRSDSYRVATTQDKDEKESPKKKGGKDLDDLKKEVPIVCTTCSISFNFFVV